MSRHELGELASYVGGMIAQLELGERFPQERFVNRLGEIFKTDRFRLIYDKLLRLDAYPENFRPWIDIEREAVVIRSYELALIPGLLQTEEYASALLGGDETKVAARIERQAILEGDPPPQFIALIHEVALRQLVGGREVMRGQLHKLLQAADRHLVQVVPWNVSSYKCLDGSFVVATVDGSDMVYLPTAKGDGYILDGREDVEKVRWRWDMIRGEALSRQQSKDLILELASDHG